MIKSLWVDAMCPPRRRAFVSVVADYQAQYLEVRLDVDLSGRMVNLVDEGLDLALRVSASLPQSLIARPIAPVLRDEDGSPVYLACQPHPAMASPNEPSAQTVYVPC